MSSTEIKVLEESEKRGHEQVCFFHYPEVGLKAIVGIHSTVLGPALGGCRMRLYENEHQAVEDVMRLSEGMTYKNSLAGLNIGGGKSCIIADSAMDEGRAELFQKFGECLNDLGGRYISAEDMGTCVDDVMNMKKNSPHVAGFAIDQGGGGDPSPWTAKGVFLAIQAACEHKFNSKDLAGKTVSIQGVGHVGQYLVGHLKNAGANVVVSDINEDNIKAIKDKFEAEVVEPERIYDVDCDIFAPCAIGQTVNQHTITRLRCSIIAGAANNQLPSEEVYGQLEDRGMLYCPDFAINAGGVISCAAELEDGGWKEDFVKTKVEDIYNTTVRILDEAVKRGKFTEQVALELARERIAEAR